MVMLRLRLRLWLCGAYSSWDCDTIVVGWPGLGLASDFQVRALELGGAHFRAA